MKKPIKTVRIKNKQSGLFLEVQETKIIQSKRINSSRQEFYLFPIKNDDYFIVSKHNSKIIEVEEKKQNTKYVAHVVQNKYTGKDNQISTINEIKKIKKLKEDGKGFILKRSTQRNRNNLKTKKVFIYSGQNIHIK